MDACLHREVGVQMLRRVLNQLQRNSGNGDPGGQTGTDNAELGNPRDLPPSEGMGGPLHLRHIYVHLGMWTCNSRVGLFVNVYVHPFFSCSFLS